MLAVPMGPSWTHIGGAVVVSVPYPHRRAIGDAEHGAAALADGIRFLHAKATVEAWPDRPIIFAGHLTAAGARVGSERSMRLEDDVSLSLDVLDLFDYAALGHIHKQQRVSNTAWYAGAPLYVDLGEAGDRKGFLLASVRARGAPTVQAIPSGDHPMFDIDWDSKTAITSTPTFGSDPDVRNAIVRVRVHDDESARQAREDFATAYFLQVDNVKEQAVMVTERALPADTAPIEALRSYLSATMPGTDLDPYLTAAEGYMA